MYERKKFRSAQNVTDVSFFVVIGEAPTRMMNPSMMVSRLDLVFLELALVGIDFN